LGKSTVVNGPDGSPQRALELNFKSIEEPWSQLEAEDGTTLHVRLVVTKIFRLLDMHDQLSGEPCYVVMTAAPQIKLDVPEKLKHFNAEGEDPDPSLRESKGMIRTRSTGP